ncbi:unnamed protein product [Owenia fusiformis]|uniref:Uncharacterized protein n=1 Tax=Owenia fusiformis TaxID=6347 RepID=A0A8J1TSJ7_OWEFU|nr:unnamed protein product [Owenia fusiformis]
MKSVLELLVFQLFNFISMERITNIQLQDVDCRKMGFTRVGISMAQYKDCVFVVCDPLNPDPRRKKYSMECRETEQVNNVNLKSNNIFYPYACARRRMYPRDCIALHWSKICKIRETTRINCGPTFKDLKGLGNRLYTPEDPNDLLPLPPNQEDDVIVPAGFDFPGKLPPVSLSESETPAIPPRRRRPQSPLYDSAPRQDVKVKDTPLQQDQVFGDPHIAQMVIGGTHTICYDVKGEALATYRLLTESASSAELDIKLGSYGRGKANLVKSVAIRTNSSDIDVGLDSVKRGHLVYKSNRMSVKTDVSILTSKDEKVITVQIGKSKVELVGKRTHILLKITELHNIDGVAGGIMGDVMHSVVSITDGMLKLRNGKTLNVALKKRFVHGNGEANDVTFSCWNVNGDIIDINKYKV